MAKKPKTITVPAPTAWPISAALGLTLVFTGFLTSWPVGAVGGVLFIISCVGWFKDCYPIHCEVKENILPHHIPSKVTTSKSTHHEHPHHRAKLPLEIHRTPSGILGGIAGGGAMVVVAIVGSLFMHGSPWYPFNVLAATFMHSLTEGDLGSFHATAFFAAIFLHLSISICIGLVYGVVLPLLPRHPIVLGALVIPFIWSFLLYASMQILNPVLNTTVNWWWFLVAQLSFGLVAGLVVSKSERIRTIQFKAFAERAGIKENQ